LPKKSKKSLSNWTRQKGGIKVLNSAKTDYIAAKPGEMGEANNLSRKARTGKQSSSSYHTEDSKKRVNKEKGKPRGTYRGKALGMNDPIVLSQRLA